MKKSIFIGVLALITLAACQNEREESFNDLSKKTERNVEDFVKAKKDNSGKPAQIDNSVYVQCNTDWSDLFGTSCIWSQGMLFKVSWSPKASPSGITYAYSTQQVSFCTCGN